MDTLVTQNVDEVPVLEGPGFGCFFIIGAQKSGTTSLFHYLEGHPDLYASRRKEPRFFLRENPTRRQCEEYLALFAGRTSERWIFEASAGYTRYPRQSGVPLRMKRAAPNARFVYLLRHPVERVFSAYGHNLAHGRERRTLDEALADDRFGYLDTSRYYLQLQQYLECFPRERILVLFFENLVKRRTETIDRILQFLDVRRDVQLSNADRTFNDTSLKRAPGTALRVIAGLPGYRWLPDRVKMYCQERWSRPLPRRADLVRPDIYNRILDALASDIDHLRGLLDDDLSMWDLSRK
jgi:hypothetical protein